MLLNLQKESSWEMLSRNIAHDKIQVKKRFIFILREIKMTDDNQMNLKK